MGKDIKEVSRHDKCPICGESTWCLIWTDERGGNICMRIAGGKEIAFKDGEVGYWYPPEGEEKKEWKRPEVKPKEVKPQYEFAPLPIRDLVYRMLITAAGISDQHRLHLLNERQIMDTGFATLQSDPDWRWMVANDIASEVTPKGVPGFYRQKDGTWNIARPRGGGLLVPVINRENLIQGMQVRMDNVNHGKYRWLSSDPEGREEWEEAYQDGTPAENVAHYAGFRMTSTIWITEGILKAQVAAYHSEEVFIGMPGARIGDREIIKDIAERVTERFILCPDGDFRDNFHVYTGWKRGYEFLRDECRARVRFALWDISDGKGIDDFILNTGSMPETVSPKVFFEMFPEEQVKAAWEAKRAAKLSLDRKRAS